MKQILLYRMDIVASLPSGGARAAWLVAGPSTGRRADGIVQLVYQCVAVAVLLVF